MTMPTQTESMQPAKPQPPQRADKANPSLTPEQIARIRAAAVSAGIPLDQGPCQLLADGGIKITITLPSEIAIPLKTWAETAQEPLHEFIEKNVIQAVTGFVFSDFGAAG